MWDQAEQALNQSMTRMLSQFASLLPGILALVVAVLMSALVAWIFGALVRRSLTGIRFDEQLAGWGFSSLKEWSPSGSPALLVTRVVSWAVVLVGFLVGTTAVDFTWTSQLVGSLFAYLPNLLGAVLVLLVGNIVARFLARSTLIGAVNLNLKYARPLSVAVKWLVIVLSVAMALEDLKIGEGVVQIAFGILFGGIVFALALAVGLGSKEMVSRSLERGMSAPPDETVEEPLHHL
jgi:mechanosensitive ion channel-like protein